MKTESRGTSRRTVLGLFAVAGAVPLANRLLAVPAAKAASLPTVRNAGFTLNITAVEDMDAIRNAKGVPGDLQSCHTAVVDGYVFEGHVPAGDVKRLLAERPTAKGLAAPGMPRSAPGMGQPGEPYAVILFGTPTGNRTYAQYPG
jgi:hypothetical protein